MNTESFSGETRSTSVDTATTQKISKLESSAFYILMATIVLAPLVFLPTPYIVIDAVKTILIALGTLISAILYGVIAYKEHSLTLPPRSVTWTSLLIVFSLIISSFTSVHLAKSFFGQGFELNVASFILILFLGALVVFSAMYRKMERVMVVYFSLTVPFILLAVFHGLRLLLGPSFMSLGVLSGATSTFLGIWNDLGTYAMMIAIIVLSALMFLPSLSRRVKIVYWALLVVAFISAFLVNSVLVWMVGALVLLTFTIYTSIIRPRPAARGIAGFLKHITWLPLILFVIAGVVAVYNTRIAVPVTDKLNITYSSLTLPWQLTLDVDAGAIKSAPLFGVGPNHFSQAYLAYKPAAINSTNAWNAEFSYAFSLFGTYVATQGLFGIVTWLIFLIFFGILAVRTLCRLPEDSHARFAIISSSFSAFFLWVMSILSVPSHAILLYTYVVTAIAIVTVVKYGGVSPYIIAPRIGLRSYKVFSIVAIILIVVGIVWGIVYAKNTAALAYFGSGVKSLTTQNDSVGADTAFARAYSLDASDIYLRARAEAGIAQATQLISTIRSDSPASTSQAILGQVSSIVNSSVKYAQAAIVYDPSNYYNYVSEARVSELATKIRMDKAYDNAVNSYTSAINTNPFNPSLYLNLAQLQAGQNKLDDAIKTIGVALQVKNNYLEAIFLLSQIEAAQGKLPEAIIAAQVAVQINPQNPTLLFQLGLLQYNNKDYTSAVKALEAVLKIQPDYANAQYFLGLSYARLNNTGDAITQFTNLAKTNPDNQEISFILTNLQAGKSPFADAKPPVTPTPEKRSSLPIKEKKK